jgi:hypothetical protein
LKCKSFITRIEADGTTNTQKGHSTGPYRKFTRNSHPQWRTQIQIKCKNKLAEIAVDQIRTISKKRLKKKIDKLSATDAAQLRKLITDMYGE